MRAWISLEIHLAYTVPFCLIKFAYACTAACSSRFWVGQVLKRTGVHKCPHARYIKCIWYIWRIPIYSICMRFYNRHTFVYCTRCPNKHGEWRDYLKVVFDFWYLMHGNESKQNRGFTSDELLINWSVFLVS